MAVTHICFLGASTTEGQGDETGLGWPGRLMDLTYPATEGGRPAAYNLGVRGQTTRMQAKRWEAECLERLPDYGKCALVASFGLNDVARVDGGPPRVPMRRTLETVRAVMEKAGSLGEVLWLGPAPVDESVMPIVSEAGYEFLFTHEAIGELNQNYIRLAAELDIPYLDLFTPLLGDAGYLAALKANDGLHPTGDGYQIVAERVAVWDAWRCLTG
ncbi:GDSL-type esterase/lipase family protein [Aestuariispira insulae]|uniref:Lysophospholipase L1-like esterase n=1 Tax=Aestuariispira insulae TaxID=1461337 RepID=A0A3D9HPZ2_9PROT|nr:GDSL-type esterase/lipase family protein [Aestuariispira insulae]RED51584.1 lysophospholipase L1-like esterase [Aestuariispira insulae]